VRLRPIKITLLLALSLMTQACSMGMFGNGIDQAVKDTKSHRKINPACSHVNLSNSEIDAKSFRELLNCLNANGGLEALNQLCKKLSDTQLQPILALVNKEILKNPARLYQLETTYSMLAEDGNLRESIHHFGRLLENEEFISSSIALLKDGYFDPSKKQGDQLTLKALQRLSIKITPAHAAQSFDLILSLASSKVFPELIKKFATHQKPGVPLQQLTDELLAYLQQDAQNGGAIGWELLNAIASKDLFNVQQDLLGRTPEELPKSIPRATSIIKVVLADQAKLLEGLSSLIHAGQAPIFCLSGGVSIKDPIQFMITEVLSHRKDPATFLKKNNVLTLTAVNPFCSFPQDLGKHFAALSALAETSALNPSVELLASVNRLEHAGKKPLLALGLKFLGDPNSKRLFPHLLELSEREVWDSLLLFSALLNQDSQNQLVELIKFLLEPSPELSNRSIYDVFSGLTLKTTPEYFYKFVQSLQKFVEAPDPLLAPASRALRQALHTNDAHPILDILQVTMKEAPNYEQVFSTLFEISELPEFLDTIRLFSEMSKDGRMEELVSTVFTLFHKFASAGSSPIQRTSIPQFIPALWHDHSTQDLIAYDEAPPYSEAASACQKVDLRIPLSATTHPEFGSQFQNVLACLNSDGEHEDYVRAFEFLNEKKNEKGQSYFASIVELLQMTNLTGPQNSFLMRSFSRAFDEGPANSGGRVFRLLGALPFWFGDKGGNAAEPLFKIAKPVIEQVRPELRRLETSIAEEVLRNENFTEILGYVRKLQRATTENLTSDEPFAPADPVSDLEVQIAKNECEGSQDSVSLAHRAQEIVYDFENAVNNWELVNGRPRDTWDIPTLKSRLEPAFQRLADPRQSAPDHTFINALLNFVKYFSLNPGEERSQTAHFSRDAFLDFFKKLSSDTRPISYIYPGETNPRVRLVNSMDRLELVLINADLDVPALKKNFGLQFTAEIAEAWGDEPFEIRPKEIQQKFPKNSRKKPKTLKQAVQHINRTFHFLRWLMRDPELPNCREATWKSKNDPSAHYWGEDTVDWLKHSPEHWEFLRKFVDLKNTRIALFNVGQVLEVLDENLPERHSDVIRVLRNLFFEFYYSTPKQFRSPRALKENNLRIAIDLVKMGIGRQPGRLLRDSARFPDADNQMIREFFAGLTEAASGTKIPEIIERIAQEPNRALFWAALGEAFGLIDSSTPEQLQLLKQLAFRTVIASHQLNLSESTANSVAAILSRHQTYLGQHTSKLKPLARSQNLSKLLKALIEDPDSETKRTFALFVQTLLNHTDIAVDGVSVLQAVDSDPKATAAWEEFVSRKDQLLASAEYLKLNLTEALDPIWDFFEEKNSDEQAAETAHKLRLYLAQELERGNLDQFLVLAAQNPAEFYQVLKVPGSSFQKGELQEFLRLVRRNLGN